MGNLSNSVNFRVGCVGFDHPGWTQIVYPEDVGDTRERFDYYSRFLNLLSMSSTFLEIPPPEELESWKERSSDGFQYSLDLRRRATYGLHLKKPDQWFPEFSGAAALLGKSEGPIIVRMPAPWEYNPSRLESFLAFAGSAHRIAFEFRNPDWLRYTTYEILRRHGAAVSFHDSIADHPLEVTADFVHLQFHGPDAKHYRPEGTYTEETLSKWAERCQRWLNKGMDVYATFHNVEDGHAFKNAVQLRKLVEDGVIPVTH